RAASGECCADGRSEISRWDALGVSPPIRADGVREFGPWASSNERGCADWAMAVCWLTLTWTPPSPSSPTVFLKCSKARERMIGLGSPTRRYMSTRVTRGDDGMVGILAGARVAGQGWPVLRRRYCSLVPMQARPP